jgi:hypothetical protein
MHHILYLSWAVVPFTNAQLQELLTLARRRNTELGITGILYYGNERFMQLLEGEEAEIRALYELIKRDPRHQHIITYVDKPVTQRVFAQWTMAFQPSDPQQAAELPGYFGSPTVAIDMSSLTPEDKSLFDLLRSFTLP